MIRRRSSSSMKNGKRVVLIGLDGAGKTTVMRQIISKARDGAHQSAPETLPTIGFTVQEIVREGHRGPVTMTLFDVGGQEKIRELWSQYCRAADALVLVVDAGDQSRLMDVRTELLKLLHGPANLSNETVVLVLANKQDQQQALSPQELVARLRLHEIEAPWHIEGTVGIDGTGIERGFDWLTSHLSHKGSRRGTSWAMMSPRGRRTSDPTRGGGDGGGGGRADVRLRSSSMVGGQIKALHSLGQELETLRVQNEQLSARLVSLEHQKGELQRENANLRIAGGAAVAHIPSADGVLGLAGVGGLSPRGANGTLGLCLATPASAMASPRVVAVPRSTPVAEVKRRALEARASAEALRRHNAALAESLQQNGSAAPRVPPDTPPTANHLAGAPADPLELRI